MSSPLRQVDVSIIRTTRLRTSRKRTQPLDPLIKLHTFRHLVESAIVSQHKLSPGRPRRHISIPKSHLAILFIRIPTGLGDDGRFLFKAIGQAEARGDGLEEVFQPWI